METNQCPICGVEVKLSQIATISTFLKEICEFEIDNTKSLFCPNCQFVFFERRLTEKESLKLYRDYRRESYNSLRLQFEPSYSEYMLQFENKFSDYWIGRTNELLHLLRKNNLMEARKILDFGGDGMIPSRLVPAAKIDVLDPSISNGSLSLSNYDLIFASEVLEHVSEPADCVLKLCSLLGQDGSLIIDVPQEYAGAIKQEWDRQRVHGGSLVTMHEHINHFSIEAILSLAKRTGCKVEDVYITPLNFIVAVFKNE